MPTHYQNPVFVQYLADPFVLKHENHYYAYGTGSLSPEGWPFPVLQSTDLANWEQRGWALIPPGGDEFWAPEVAHHDGVFQRTAARQADPVVALVAAHVALPGPHQRVGAPAAGRLDPLDVDAGPVLVAGSTRPASPATSTATAARTWSRSRTPRCASTSR